MLQISMLIALDLNCALPNLLEITQDHHTQRVHVKKNSAHLCTLYFSYKELDYTPLQMKLKPTNPLQDAGVSEKYESSVFGKCLWSSPVVTRIIKAQEISPPWGEKCEGGT